VEEQWLCDRVALRELLRDHPEYSRRQLAEALGRSVAFVKKWKKRLGAAAPDDERVLWSRSSARKTPQPQLDPRIVERILAIRDQPPDNLKRIPGPKTIAYFLQKDAKLLELNLKPPTSSRTIWKVLDKHQRIARPKVAEPHPLCLSEPYTSWQLDAKDNTWVEVEPDGKQQHLIEVLNVVDTGTSALLTSRARGDYNAQSVLLEMKSLISEWGLPKELTFDRDPRFVGSASGRDFPSAFVRFWLCLGVKVNICPPHRPDLNCYVERFHRAQGGECLTIHRPKTVAATQEVVTLYKHHYNLERPHQGKSCHNTPPMIAHPPPVFRQPPALFINPNQWLFQINGRRYARKVQANGTVVVANQRYYVGTAYAKQYVALVVEAPTQQFRVCQKEKELGCVAIKGLYRGLELSFEDYHALMVAEATREKAARTFYVSPSGEAIAAG
jgi:hypothetical protein